MSKQQTYENVKSVLQELKVAYIEENSMIGFQATIDAPTRSVLLIIDIQEDFFVVTGAYSEITVAQDKYPDMCELLMRLNTVFLFPEFKLQPAVGDNYRTECSYVETYRRSFYTKQEILNCINEVLQHMTLCAAAVISVNRGIQSPEAACVSVANNIR